MKSTKELVLNALISSSKCEDGFVSGQELAEKCGVSRTAVWKAVNALVKEGVEIQAVTNRGYKLIKDSSALSENQLQVLVPSETGITFKVFQQIDSTNLECKRLCAQVANFRKSDGTLTEQGKKLHLHVVVADSQTAGRGRLGRNFYSPAKSGLYLSMIYIPKTSIVQPAKMTATAAVAVCRSIKKIFNLETKIKWVNDIFLNGKKICGILTEGIANFETGGIEAAIVGIGINLCQSETGFPKEIENVAGSLLGNIDNPAESTKRNKLAAQIAIELVEMYSLQEKSQTNSEFKKSAELIMREYRERNFLIGETVEISPVIEGTEKYKAKVLDITDEAALVVQKADGTTLTLQSGEITLHSGQKTFCHL